MNDDTSQSEQEGSHGPALLEWVAGAVGALVVAGMIGTIGYQAWSGDGSSVPQIALKVSSVHKSGDYFVAEVAAENRSDTTAEQVEIEATLKRGGKDVEKGRLTLDYLPGDSKAEGGIYFTNDPRTGELELRPLGYSQP